MNKRTVFLCSMKRAATVVDLENQTSAYIDALRAKLPALSKDEFRAEYAKFAQNPLLPGLNEFIKQTLVALKYRADYLESDCIRFVELLLQTSN